MSTISLRPPAWILAFAALCGSSSLVHATSSAGAPCAIPMNIVNAVQSKLAVVVVQVNGGIFSPNRMWSSIVDRQGKLCSVAKIGDAWPGSRAISIAKANTANSFSNDALPLSTANLYAATQPGGPLYGLNNSNPFNPDFLVQGVGTGKVPGGVITFGGGVPLYRAGKVIGGLGVSGDSACADHVIAFRMRRLAGLAPAIAGVGFGGTDNVSYAVSGADPVGFEHPRCGGGDIPEGSI
jgi:uncharacterized protein GlcG (DUF336 family)